jgi:hypothetical protein
MHRLFKKQNGQIMLLTTLVMSGTILAATTVAGLLMVYQIRQSGNAEQSTKAIYAADAGLEFQLYRVFTKDCQHETPVLTNGASISSRTVLQDGATADAPQDVIINSSGQASKTYRSFIVSLGAYTDTLPCTDEASSSTP